MRPSNAMDSDQQISALAALDVAGEQAITDGADPDRVREVLRVHVADLALDDAGVPLLLIEAPQPGPDSDPSGYGYKLTPRYSAAVRATADIGGAEGARAQELAYWLQDPARRPTPLVEGVRLLASDESPPKRLNAWRAELARIRADYAALRAAQLEQAKLDEAEKVRYWRENGERHRTWDALPRPLQLLHDALAPLPQYADLLEALTKTVNKFDGSMKRVIPMPSGFRPDLRDLRHAKPEQTLDASAAVTG